MLVDDDETCNYISEKIISKLNLSSHTHIVKNGREALNFIEENCTKSNNNFTICPDLILLDINMPVMDGIEFLEELYNNKNIEKLYTNSVSIYILSSSDNPSDMKKVSKYNIKGYLSKPITVDKIIAISDK